MGQGLRPVGADRRDLSRGEIGIRPKGTIQLDVNGKTRQKSDSTP